MEVPPKKQVLKIKHIGFASLKKKVNFVTPTILIIIGSTSLCKAEHFSEK